MIYKCGEKASKFRTTLIQENLEKFILNYKSTHGILYQNKITKIRSKKESLAYGNMDQLQTKEVQKYIFTKGNKNRLFVRMTISSEVAVHQISFEHTVVNIS